MVQKMSNKKDNKIIETLVELEGFGKRSAEIGVRAGFKCEYCDKDLLASPDAYKGWQEDHIIPLSSGGKDISDNIALSCRECNVNYKGRWNPLTVIENNAERKEKIAEVRQYVFEKRSAAMEKLLSIRRVINK